MDEILGFSLSQEELLVALLMAALPTPIGFDELESLVFRELSEETRAAILAVAERGLIARGLLLITTDATDPDDATSEPLTLDEYVQQTLQICTQPEKSWIFLHQPVGEIEQASYFHQRSDQLFGHIEMAGIHQFIELTQKSQLFETASVLVSPVPATWHADKTGNLAESIFSTLANSAMRPNRQTVQQTLLEAGLPADLATAFAETIDTLKSITAFARISHAFTAEIERAFTVVCGENTQWLLTLSAPNTLQLKSISPETLQNVLHDFSTA